MTLHEALSRAKPTGRGAADRRPRCRLGSWRVPSSDLTAALAVALGATAEPVGPFLRAPLVYDSFQAGRQVSRLTGEALVHGRRQTWSLIEKATSAAGLASPDLYQLARRELSVARSGLLESPRVLEGSAPGLRPVPVYGAVERADGTLVLYTQDLGPHQQWPVESFVDAARDLGRFNGRWLGRVPAEPWLFSHWASRHNQPSAIDLGRRIVEDGFASAQPLRGLDLSEALALFDAQPDLVDVLGALPITLCHHDAVQSNLFWAAGSTMAIDWELIGPGPIGADLASLLFSSGRRGDLPVPWLSALRPRAVAAYSAGAAEVGADLDPAAVQLGFDAAVSLRWSLLRDVVELSSGDGAGQVRGSLPQESRPESIRQLALLSAFLLESAARVDRGL